MENSHYSPQENDYYCGPAVAAMVLAQSGVVLPQAEIAKELETDFVVGTSAKELETFFLRRGFEVVVKNNAQWEDIATELERGFVIVGYVEREGDPHYALITKVNEEAITLDDPWHGEGFILPREEFLKRWRDDEVGQYGERMLMSVTPRR